MKLKKKKILIESNEKETPGENEKDVLQLYGKNENEDDICDFGLFENDNINSNINSLNKMEQYNEKEMYDDYDNDYMKQNNIYFRKNPFMNVFEENHDKILGKKNKKFYIFPGKGYLKDENFKIIMEKGFFSMKDILKDVIDKIKKNKYTNVFGTVFKGKIKLCEETYKYFYMNGFFTKGIYIVDIKNINSIKSLPEFKNHKKDKKNKVDILIVIENIEEDNKNKLNNTLFEWLEKLDIHILFISSKKLENIKYLKNENCYDIDTETENYKKNNSDFEEEYKGYKEIKFG